MHIRGNNKQNYKNSWTKFKKSLFSVHPSVTVHPSVKKKTGQNGIMITSSVTNRWFTSILSSPVGPPCDIRLFSIKYAWPLWPLPTQWNYVLCLCVALRFWRCTFQTNMAESTCVVMKCYEDCFFTVIIFSMTEIVPVSVFIV